MARDNIKVPFGYEPEEEKVKGTFIAYGPFQTVRGGEVEDILGLASTRGFKRVVFYPIHEETGKRMGWPDLEAYHRRVDALEEVLEASAGGAAIPWNVDHWEGKRKKYTPIETALRFLTEKHPAPYFLWMHEETAAKFATYASFEEWIRKVRLLVAPPYGNKLPPKLEEYGSRWEYVR